MGLALFLHDGLPTGRGSYLVHTPAPAGILKVTSSTQRVGRRSVSARPDTVRWRIPCFPTMADGFTSSPADGMEPWKPFGCRPKAAQKCRLRITAHFAPRNRPMGNC